ncbi:MAG: SUMF1/EgtB/PvdO family nonheme iron enzyme [Anaerolineae bacterium]|nr:SUMF1/EgtB/PvdO family nonheme iron enzyme [Anaerolineae bacterium]
MSKSYDFAKIRKLLIEGFVDDELRAFCFDSPEFRSVYHQLTQKTDKTDVVQKLLAHAEKQMLIDQLLAWAREQNPVRYETNQPYETSEVKVNLTSKVSSHRLRIFLCHASADKEVVRELYHRLLADGFEPWLDEEDLLPGQKWQLEIPKAVRSADLVIVCLSRQSITKAGYVQKEIRFALEVAEQQPEESIFLIPLRLEDCIVPEMLREWHWVDFFHPKGYERLVRSLRKKAEAKIEAEAKAETESKGKVEPVIGKKKPRPKVPPADRYLGGVRDEEAMAYFRERLSRQEDKTKPEQKTTDPQPPTPLPHILPRRFDFEPEMILIPAGEFLMGSDPKVDKRARENEQPQHVLALPDYYMAKTPVTNTQYVAFIQASGHEPPEHWQNNQPPNDQENHPVVGVSWDDAVAYCRWLAETTGKPYRLPSEAEWEKGARGTDGRIYPWGNQWDAKRCNAAKGRKGSTTPVDAYPAGASPYGLLDMTGNVWEWTRSLWGKDWVKPDFGYPYNPVDDREDVEATGYRVMRGGSFFNRIPIMRCTYRDRNGQRDWYRYYGFRVLVSPFS